MAKPIAPVTLAFFSIAVCLILFFNGCTNKADKTDAATNEESQTSGLSEKSLPDKKPDRNTSVFFGEADYYQPSYQGNPLIRITGVKASSEKTDASAYYSADNLIDQTWHSWAEGSAGNGKGEHFTLTLAGDETVAGFALKNGYGHLDYYSKNNRVKSFTVYFDEKDPVKIPIKDSISFEQYVFDKPITCSTVRFVIDDVYPGTDFNDTCISEIALIDEAVSDRDFYENILFWLGHYGYEGPTQFDGNPEGVSFVTDADKNVFWDDISMLRDFMPFDYPPWEIKTNVALLGRASSLKFTDNLPRLDGATAMYPLYSSFVHAVYPEENDFLKKLEREISWAYDPKNPWGIVQCNTTAVAYQRLIDGETDIVICYEPSEAEKKAAADAGKRFYMTPIAKDAFVFIVNSKNMLNSITQQQIRDIYSGRVTNWKPISGVDEFVIAYQRPKNSGSQTTLQAIMKNDTLMRPILEGEYIPEGMSGMIRSVASNYYNYNNAIGYSFLFYLTKMDGGKRTKVLAVDGIMPNRQTIQNNTYPFVQTVYAVTTGNESENTRKFIAWMQSPQGQELVGKTGYIPIK